MSVRIPYKAGKTVAPGRPSKCAKFQVFLDEEERPVQQTPQAVRSGGAAQGPAQEVETKPIGEILLNDVMTSDARVRGCLFSLAINDDGTIDFFAHRPYEEMQDLAHEDLSPMFYQATVRGRIEHNDRKEPELILKNPQVVREYFEFKNVAEREFSAEKYNELVRDEYIRIARLLAKTGISPKMTVHATGLRRFFPDYDTCFGSEPFALEVLARQELTR